MRYRDDISIKVPSDVLDDWEVIVYVVWPCKLLGLEGLEYTLCYYHSIYKEVGLGFGPKITDEQRRKC